MKIDCQDYLGDGECWQLADCRYQFTHQKCCIHCEKVYSCEIVSWCSLLS